MTKDITDRLKALDDTPPPGFMARCPSCNHELCGQCGEVHKFDETVRRNVRVSDYCCQCEHEFQIEGKRYGA